MFVASVHNLRLAIKSWTKKPSFLWKAHLHFSFNSLRLVFVVLLQIGRIINRFSSDMVSLNFYLSFEVFHFYLGDANLGVILVS